MGRFAVCVMATCGLLGCTNVNRAALVASTLAIACDAAQTYRTADAGWGRQNEGNPILGREPVAPVVLAYFSVAIIANAAIWAVMPKSIKSMIPAAVTVVQMHSIAGNLETTRSMCGVPVH